MAGIFRFLSRMSQSCSPARRTIILSSTALSAATNAIQCQWGEYRRNFKDGSSFLRTRDKERMGANENANANVWNIECCDTFPPPYSLVRKRESMRVSVIFIKTGTAYKRFSLESKLNIIRRSTLCRAMVLWSATTSCTLYAVTCGFLPVDDPAHLA